MGQRSAGGLTPRRDAPKVAAEAKMGEIMRIHRRREWESRESEVTPEAAALSRRALLAGVASAAAVGLVGPARGAAPDAALYPFPRNERYAVHRPLSAESDVTTYNNFYEFASVKNIWKAAQRLQTDGWTVAIDGFVEREMEVGVEELLARMPRDERIYRHRCVEAWAMTVPWSGFALAALVALARPTARATFVRFESFHRPEISAGQRQRWFPWPYTEGLTMAEATNELAFVATGLYGKPLAKQNGAPLRLVVPWKYGFKSIKSIQRITFTDDRPATFWNTINDRLYGFWANVNPDVPFPDWSQKEERLLGGEEKVPTRIYNGYGPYVAHLYSGMEGRKIFF